MQFSLIFVQGTVSDHRWERRGLVS